MLASRLHSISFEAAVSKYLRNDDNHNNNKTFNQPIPIRMRQFKLLGQYGGREYTDLYTTRRRKECVCVCVCVVGVGSGVRIHGPNKIFLLAVSKNIRTNLQVFQYTTSPAPSPLPHTWLKYPKWCLKFHLTPRIGSGQKISIFS